MTITDISFFIFVVAVLVVYYICPKKFRWLVLLAASVTFYCIVCLKYIPYIIVTAITTWGGALWLDKVTKDRKALLQANKSTWDRGVKKQFKKKTTTYKRLILALILVINFGILGFLKYYNWFGEWISSIFGVQFSVLNLVLPLGISFYTFQAMGYIIDVYWEKTAPEKNLAKFGLFVSFFPQIIQGPIGIYNDLAQQLYDGHDLQFRNIQYGFQLILWGLFKKMVIADRLVVVVNNILPIKNELANGYSLLALLVYAMQIYMDFSGGIDIVRGVAQMLGIEMAVNFKRPYFSTSVTDFWRRWHASLGHWMRTYLFYPIAVSGAFLSLGGKISGLHKKQKEYKDGSVWGGVSFAEHLGKVIPGCIATLITFLVVGLWHGANWKYVGYGLWNGLVILIAMLLDPVFQWMLNKMHIRTTSGGWKIWRIFRTFFIIIGSYIFDIADSFTDGVHMLGKCLTPILGPTTHLGDGFDLGLEATDWIVAVLGLLVVLGVSLYQETTKKSVRDTLSNQTLWLQWTLTMGCLIAVIIFGVYGPGVSAGEFVYMQF